MVPETEHRARGVRLAALFLLLLLAAGPGGTHAYWLLGGTWGLHRSGADGTSTGIRLVAALVLLLLAAAALVVLAHVGAWRQAVLSNRAVRVLVWILAGVFLLEALASFTWSRDHEWWLYGPVSLLIAALAAAVALSPPSLPLRLVVAAVTLAGLGVGAALLVDSSRGGRTVGSGIASAEARDVPAFTAVELKATNDVAIHVGGTRRVLVRGDDNLLPLVTTRVEHGVLVIGASHGFTTRRPMRVDVTVPSLETVTLAGSGIVAADGRVSRLSATLSGTGQLQLASLVARDVVTVLAGTGRVDVTATHSLDAIVAGSGAIFYGGDPSRVTKDVSGRGTIAPR